MAEERRPIPGWPGYECTVSGEVIGKRGKPLKTSISNRGTRKITLYANNRLRTFPVHRLILMTFRPREDLDRLLVKHIDGDNSNNKLSNLEWAVSYRTSKRLSSEDLYRIAALRDEGLTYKAISEQIGCTVNTVYKKIKEMGLQRKKGGSK